MILSCILCAGLLSKKEVISFFMLREVFCLLMMGMICGRYFLSVMNCVLVLVVQFIEILCNDMGSL